MGRPTKLTDEICEAIVDSIKEGIPPGTAAELHGITRRTHERWLKRGREAKRKTKYTEYCRRIEGAKAYASKTHLHAIMESKDWKARKYLLTLLDTTYALPDKLELSGQVDSKVEADVKVEYEIPEDPTLRGRGRDLIQQIRAGQMDSGDSGDGGK